MSLIVTRNLTKRYGSKTALDDVSLQVEAGAPVALVGPNGAGKTTLMSLMCGYIQPDGGSLEILGHVPGSRQLLGKVCALPQDALLDPNFSVGEQLSFFASLQGFSAKDARREAERVLELVELKDAARHKPTALSHGMGKRVAIAQALIGTPQLVLLDEPTAGLDPANARAVRELISHASEQTTFLISSHNLEELERLCDTVLYLDKGKLSQSLSIKSESVERFLTLSLQDSAGEELGDKLSTLPGVHSVKRQHNGREFIIGFEPASRDYGLEKAALELLAIEGIRYRQLLNGKSLEDKLFS
ncbi:ABC transporter ATP-binding protein [Shewanella amazonensis]|uniref:ABC transporter, ATP-binding protein n=1 Tax=Shewanella amazonensis (strain ATCC BAA-1098 / SB2B) TaxID=326297 RepID=A1S718_SHEAM|nr:ABC transporter ATP-binding protein [Shewanella amazonensis]ABM00175.1 ABC transporter, ATP-binding protein [Shewanella amazonensis SB2B]